jgi:hypothetical protein
MDLAVPQFMDFGAIQNTQPTKASNKKSWYIWGVLDLLSISLTFRAFFHSFGLGGSDESGFAYVTYHHLDVVWMVEQASYIGSPASRKDLGLITPGAYLLEWVLDADSNTVTGYQNGVQGSTQTYDGTSIIDVASSIGRHSTLATHYGEHVQAEAFVGVGVPTVADRARVKNYVNAQYSPSIVVV